LSWKCEIRKKRNKKGNERTCEEKGRRNTTTEESRKVGEINDEENELKKERRDMERLKEEQANN
jgi:hypothetical protein